MSNNYALFRVKAKGGHKKLVHSRQDMANLPQMRRKNFFFLKKLSEIMDVFLCDLGTFWSVLSHQDQYYEGLVQICIL